MSDFSAAADAGRGVFEMLNVATSTGSFLVFGKDIFAVIIRGATGATKKAVC